MESAFSVSARLLHYKRREVQEEMCLHAQEREVAMRYGERGFGSRPDMLAYPADVFEAVKAGATSFHCSEERWSDALVLEPGMKPEQLSALRVGWDLVLDVDCKVWEHAKLVASLLVQALRQRGVRAVSCKFSGNKGFHIGVPFEAFPAEVDRKPVSALFPEGVHWIARYLAYLIDQKEKGRPLSAALVALGLPRLAEQLGVREEELTAMMCAGCGNAQPATEEKFSFLCTSPLCRDFNLQKAGGEKEFLCGSCGKIRERFSSMRSSEKCPQCGAVEFEERLNIALVLNLDVQLISARHLYRMPYSMHEKSGLVSLPIDPERIMAFEREEARPESVEVAEGLRFLDRSRAVQGEAKELLTEARDHWASLGLRIEEKKSEYRDIEVPQEALPEAAFPPCMLLGKQGLRDGRKRFMFAALNFLQSAGWSPEQIEQWLKEWNARNPEQLSETLVQGQLRYHKKRALPPNCDNKHYYVEIGICKPDELCAKIRNPVSYIKRKARYSSSQ